MANSITYVLLVPSIDDGNATRPPGRLIPTKYQECLNEAYKYLLNTYRIRMEDWVDGAGIKHKGVLSQLLDYPPIGDTVTDIYRDACAQCARIMTAMAQSGTQPPFGANDKVLSDPPEGAYREIRGNEHEATTWLWPRINSVDTDWGITINPGISYNVFLMLILKVDIPPVMPFSSSIAKAKHKKKIPSDGGKPKGRKPRKPR